METSQEKKESIKTDKITGKRRFLKMYVFVCLFVLEREWQKRDPKYMWRSWRGRQKPSPV